jgi:hypothetical protein
MTRQKKVNMVNHITNETINYEEFAKFRQRYLVMYSPFKTFGKKEEKKSMNQKIKEWFDTNMKIKRKNKEEVKDKNLLKESKNKSSLLHSFGHFSESVMWFKWGVDANKNAHQLIIIKFGLALSCVHESYDYTSCTLYNLI